MILVLLILVHLLTKNGSAAPVTLSLALRSSAGTCDDINDCRKLFDIVWGCLATIFVVLGCQCIRMCHHLTKAG
ncbi:hypothetical protein B0H19DRAFT_1327923 [Mycena capillaripes]|nr:hypothetical protein B0H19DRAFT_1327923 [Mycena capillaripes]